MVGMTPDNMPLVIAGLYVGIVMLVGAIEWVWLKAKRKGVKLPQLPAWLKRARAKAWGID